MTPWRPDLPYNALPLLPPRGDLETKAVLKACVSARSSLAGLNHVIEHITDPTMLINTLPNLEARASTAIENIVTTADKLFRHAQSNESADPATREALRYRAALLTGFEEMSSRPLNTRTAEAICSRIKDAEMSVRKVPGTQVVRGNGEVIYTPPMGESLLRDLLSNWERFLHEQPQLDPLVRMAVGHYQFEAIHPFTDGNGRTGRVLNSLYLVHEKLLPSPVLYLSRYIITRRDEYYRLLLGVTRDQTWEEWLLYMLAGVDETAHWTTAKILAVRDLRAATNAYIRQRLPKIYSAELVNVLFEQPYCRIGNLVEGGVGKRVTASRYLQQLVGIGVLREEPAGRDKLFVHTKLMKLLTEDSNTFSGY
jgi:Fic family protein